MKLIGISLLLIFSMAACEKKPTAEELEQKRLAEELAKNATATPKPGDWMWKNYRNPLDGATPGTRTRAR